MNKYTTEEISSNQTWEDIFDILKRAISEDVTVTSIIAIRFIRILAENILILFIVLSYPSGEIKTSK